MNKAPKASSVIIAIQKLIDEHSDLPFYIEDADTGWMMTPGVYLTIDEFPNGKKCFAANSDYNGDPEGEVVDA